MNSTLACHRQFKFAQNFPSRASEVTKTPLAAGVCVHNKGGRCHGESHNGNCIYCKAHNSTTKGALEPRLMQTLQLN